MSTLTVSLPKPIGVEDDLALTEQQISHFQENGFLSIDTITPRAEAWRIRETLEKLFATSAGVNEGATFDILTTGEKDAPSRLPQMLNPENYASQLRQTEYLRNATRIARQILGPEAQLAGSFVILKPAQVGAATPWHQDEAFRDPRFEYREITIWMPLQDVDVDSGCMHFIAGSHKNEILPHRSPSNNTKAHGLECIGAFDASKAVACPLPMGGCTVHTCRTLHTATPNLKGIARYAYILVFHLPPKPIDNQRVFPWLVEKQSAERATKKAWLMRGGIFIMAWRKLRRGDLWTINGLRYAIKRGMEEISAKHRPAAPASKASLR